MVILGTLPSILKSESLDAMDSPIVKKPTTPSAVDKIKQWSKVSKARNRSTSEDMSPSLAKITETRNSPEAILVKVQDTGEGVVKNSLKRDSSIDAPDIEPKKLRAEVTQNAEDKGAKKGGGKKGAKVVVGGKSPKTHMKKFIAGNLDKTAKYKAIMIQNKGVKNGPGGDSAKPDWTILKQESKDKLKERKMKKCRTMYDKVVEAKQLWEKLRLEKGDHTGLTTDIHNLLKTHLAEVVFMHDMSRIIQWLLHLGSQEMCIEIISELLPEMKKMIVSKYGNKCVMKMLKYGNRNSKELIVQSFMGNLVKFTRNVLSAPVVELAYAGAATAVQQNQMRQEFYSDLFKLSKDDAVHGLEDIFRLMPQLRDAHLSCTKKNLAKMFEKKMCQSTLFFDVLRDYLRHCSSEDKTEMLGQVREMLTELPDCDSAAEVGMQCVVHASNKEKKSLMKSLKGNVVKMSKAKHLHQVVLALIESIDDTVAFGKILVPEMVANARELSAEPGGRNVLAYLTVRQDATYWTTLERRERFNACLLGGTSKKSADQRQKDVLSLVSTALLDSVAADTVFWLRDTKVSLVTLCIYKSGSGEALERAYKALCALVCDPDTRMMFHEDNMPVVEHPGIVWLLKKLVRLNHPEGVGKLLASVLADHLSTPVILNWLDCNRGAFLILLLLETENEAITEKVTSKLMPFTEELKKPNKASPVKQIILRKLSGQINV